MLDDDTLANNEIKLRVCLLTLAQDLHKAHLNQSTVSDILETAKKYLDFVHRELFDLQAKRKS